MNTIVHDTQEIGELMNFLELVTHLKKLPLEDKRKESTGYFEFVIRAADLAELYPVLEQYFGVPFKPAGIKPTSEADRVAEAYGGVQKQQTLYYREKDGLSNCGMIWPWNDGARATVKLAQGDLKKGGSCS